MNNATFRNLTPLKTNVPGLASTWSAAPGAANNLMQYRFYFDPATGVNFMPSLWDKYPRLASSDNIAALFASPQPSQTQRAYEMNSKAIQTSDQMLQKLGQL